MDVFVHGRTARVERPLTYAVPAEMTVGLGDVVRVPLGRRDLYGYVVSDARDARDERGLRPIAAKSDGPAAFDRDALALARFIAERYCCSLGEALGAVVFAPAIPHVVDRFRLAGSLEPERYPNVPPRLLRLVRDDFADGFARDAVLRHPDARRAGDRPALVRALDELVRGGALVRERRFVAPRAREAVERVLEATGTDASGPRVRALVAHVAAAGTLRRGDALLAGYSHAIVARAVRAGALREFERLRDARRAASARDDATFAPTGEQRAAIHAIDERVDRGAFAELLVQGVTGSGKTFVYLRAIAHALARGGRAIVLVPEIALTPQTARRFEGAFGARVAVLHSALSERERFESWRAAARGDVDVVVGARSAVFAPLRDVRLIVIDEAHERSYKQDGVPRYDTLAVARERMRLGNGVLVLGSATPPLEAYERARMGAIACVRLDRRATELPLPATTIVDLAAEFERGNRRIFSTRLVDALGLRLERREKSVLFVNRRGSATFVLCRACGAVPECARCSVSLAAHRTESLLRCHLCDAQRPLPAVCPACGGGPVREFGVGTQKVVDEVAALFPAARVVRVDSDTTTRVGDHARLLDEFARDGDVLVGTQMIAKGLDFPTVTLTGVVAADIGLHVPDFRAAERTFDLIAQVSGRSGRTMPGETIVQTYAPTHPAIVFAAAHDVDGFARWELATRRDLAYPPFGELVYLGVVGRSHDAVIAAATRYRELLTAFADAEILGPAPYPVARVNDEWRYRIAIKIADGTSLRRYLRETLREIAAGDAGIRLAINVDP